MDHQQWEEDPHCDANEGGNSWWSGNIIRIRTSSPDGMFAEGSLREVLLHEILHMCYEDSNMRHAGNLDKDELEEWIVGSLSPSLHAVMVDNPKVFDYIVGYTGPTVRG